MKVLLDECVPRGFKSYLSSEDWHIATVPEAGLAGKKNGELLDQAELSFDILITLDQGFAHQQNLMGRDIAIILISASSNRLKDLLPHAQGCRDAIAKIKRGQILRVGHV